MIYNIITVGNHQKITFNDFFPKYVTVNRTLSRNIDPNFSKKNLRIDKIVLT